MQIGDTLPDFTLKDQNRDEFNLYDIKDKMVLLSFHPLAWTGVCAKQMQSLETTKAELDEMDVLAVGISVDSDPSKNAWAKELRIEETRLLSDFWPHGELAKTLGVFLDDKGVAKRANVLIGKNKEVVFMKIYEMSVVPDLDEITDFIRNKRKKRREL